MFTAFPIENSFIWITKSFNYKNKNMKKKLEINGKIVIYNNLSLKTEYTN